MDVVSYVEICILKLHLQISKFRNFRHYFAQNSFICESQQYQYHKWMLELRFVTGYCFIVYFN